MFTRVIAENGAAFYRSSIIADACIAHAFSTRCGGVSTAPFDTLNFGNPTGESCQDSVANIVQNYKLLQEAIGLGERNRCTVHQVHGSEILDCSHARDFQVDYCADAMITDDPTRLLAVRTADCVPILLATRDGRRVAAVHAGWRGVVKNVAARTACQLQADSKTQIAAIGPSIGFDHFEVGGEVLSEFSRIFGTSPCIRSESGGKGFVDLRALIRQQLIETGMEPDSIEACDACTVCNREDFFSHRRDNGVTGRMTSMIGARR